MVLVSAFLIKIPIPIVPAKKNMVAENIGIPFFATYVVSRYFIDVSIIPDPKNNNIGNNNPLFELTDDLDFMDVK